MNVCFLDTETTGLDPDRHSIWEVALITPEGNEHVWQFRVDEITADPFALDIGRWWDRRWRSDILSITEYDAIYEAHTSKSRFKNFPDQGLAITPNAGWCRHFRDLTAGLHLAGAVVSFDEERLRRLLRSKGVLPRWHYHLVDVEALAAGYIAGARNAVSAASVLTGEAAWAGTDAWRAAEGPSARPPWNSGDLSRAVGVEPDDFDRHTALGDARWAKDIYEAVMGK